MSLPRLILSSCLLWLLPLSGCVRAVPPISTEILQVQVPDWEDRRSLGGGALTAFAVNSPSVPQRVRALRALARIQDPSTLEVVLAGLGAAEAPVRDEAAFAAGVLALSWEPLTDAEKARMTEALLAAEAAEQEAGVHRTLLESLGKLATPGALQRLTARLTDGRPGVPGRAALALGVAARRGASLVEVPLAPAVALLQPGQPEEARYGGAYLLANAKRPAALEHLRRCLADAAPDVRALCVKGMGDVGGPEDAAVAGRLLRDEVPRVAAEAARTLAKLASRCSGDCTPLDELLALAPRASQVARGDAAAGHALLALAQYGLPPFGRRVLVALRQAVQDAAPQASAEVAGEDLANLDCRLAAALDRQTGTLEEVLRCGGGRVPEARRLALGLREVAQARGQGGASGAVPYLGHPDTRVRLAALEAVSARPTPEAAEPVRALIGGEDLVVAASAASTAGKLKDAEALPRVRALAERVPSEPDIAEPVAGALVALAGKGAEEVLRTWLPHPHANVRRVAGESLTELTGQPVRAPRVELPVDTRRPDPAPAGATLTFRTRKGDFSVALDAQEAPLTSGNLVTLARQGYFRDITFHRVVPDFVAQGGDPRGDGEGGPGYSIRCEITRRPYRRGVMGMALAGKDTGGSQFFFTHSPQPHLDGRYTAFGEVTQGMEVVDRLLEGDVILAVEVGP
jgi:cyclophilin family peptidyl-prolyl cis-trans isomerase/HEAT repeat protein